MRIFIFLIILLYCVSAFAGEPLDYKEVKCVIHIHTDISVGTKTLEYYVKEAKEKGIGAIILTDTHWQRWEYGVPPFRGLIKKVVEEKSVMTYGIKKYLNLINKMNEKYKDVVVIDGVQVNPFYYWSGNFFKGTMTLNNRNKDMLVIGLGNAKDYINMPLVTNRKSRFDAYHDDKFAQPYQDLIDYVIERDGLIFWAHPECEEDTKMDGIILHTAAYDWDLVGTHNYTGFAIFWDGYKETGKPGGLWDRILTEYCQGKRKQPVWAIGELGEEGTGNKNFDDLVNVVYVKNLSRQQVLNALRKGRFYVAFNTTKRVPLVLDEFTVSNESGTKTAMSSEEVSFSSDPIIKIRISPERDIDRRTFVKLIRNNKIIEQFRCNSLVEIEYKDEGLVKNQKYYYRIDVMSSDCSQLISNPIFYKKTP